MPFGSGATHPNGFQGKYSPWDRGVETETETDAPTQRQIGLQKPPVSNQNRIRQGWQNIYRTRPTEGQDSWPDAQNRVGQGDEPSKKRVFGDTSLAGEGEEQWPDRSKAPEPYRPMRGFQPFFGEFAPNMMPPVPNVPYNGYLPYGQNNSRYR